MERDFRDELETLAQPIVAVDVLPIGRPCSGMLNRVLRYEAEFGNVLRSFGSDDEMEGNHFAGGAGYVGGQRRGIADAATVCWSERWRNG
jgi:hypothetical protein